MDNTYVVTVVATVQAPSAVVAEVTVLDMLEDNDYIVDTYVDDVEQVTFTELEDLT